MSLKLEHRLGVKAPAHVIWEIISDLSTWHEWNPIYPEAKGMVAYGERLTLTLDLGGSRRVIQPTILDWAPDEAIHWRLSMLGGLVATTRYLEIEKMHETGCIFSNGEIFAGLIGPTVARQMRRPIRSGFAAMGEALRERAESRWRQAGGAPT